MCKNGWIRSLNRPYPSSQAHSTKMPVRLDTLRNLSVRFCTHETNCRGETSMFGTRRVIRSLVPCITMDLFGGSGCRYVSCPVRTVYPHTQKPAAIRGFRLTWSWAHSNSSEAFIPWRAFSNEYMCRRIRPAEDAHVCRSFTTHSHSRRGLSSASSLSNHQSTTRGL